MCRGDRDVDLRVARAVVGVDLVADVVVEPVVAARSSGVDGDRSGCLVERERSRAVVVFEMDIDVARRRLAFVEAVVDEDAVDSRASVHSHDGVVLPVVVRIDLGRVHRDVDVSYVRAAIHVAKHVREVVVTARRSRVDVDGAVRVEYEDARAGLTFVNDARLARGAVERVVGKHVVDCRSAVEAHHGVVVGVVDGGAPAPAGIGEGRPRRAAHDHNAGG